MTWSPPFLAGFPIFSDQVAFSINPNTAYTAAQLRDAWVDCGWRVRSTDAITQGRQYELAQQQAGSGGWLMRNDDEALNPSNTSSPYYPNVLPYRPCRTVAAYPQDGNLLNDSNAAWVDAPVVADDGSFDGSIGHWTAIGPTAPTLSTSTTHVHDGSHAMRFNFASSPGVISNGNGGQLRLPVIPGVPTTIAGWFWLASPMTQAELKVASTVSAVDSTVGSFVQVSLTITPTTTTVLLQALIAGTGSGNAWLDSLTVTFGTAVPGSFSSTGPTLYADFYGYIERWPETWTMAGFFGWANVPLIDAFALLPRITLADVMTQEVIADAPDAYYPCTDPSGSLTVAERSGHNLAAGRVYLNTNLPATTVNALCTVGDSQSVTGEAFPSVKLSTVTIPQGPFIALSPAASVGAGPWTIAVSVWVPPDFGAFQYTTVYDQTFYVSDAANDYAVGVQIAVESDGSGNILFIADAGQVFALMGPSLPSAGILTVPYTGGHNYDLLFTCAADNKTVELFVNGVSQGTSVAASSMPTAAAIAPCIGSRNVVFASAPVNVGQVRVWTSRVVSSARAAQQGFAAVSACSGELSGARYARLLSYSTTALSSSVDAGMSSMGPALGLNGAGLRAALQDVVAAEGGNHYMARGGQVVFEGRATRYLEHTATWVFGENTAGGEIPYLGDIAFDFDPQYIVNDVTATRPGGTPQTASDVTSIGRFFDSTANLTPNLYDDNQAADVATWTVGQYKDPHQRLASLTFDPASYQAAWVCALSISQGQRVTVKRRTSAGVTMSLDFYVEQIARPRGPGKYTVTLLLSPVWTTTVWQLADATYGVLGSTTILAR